MSIDKEALELKMPSGRKVTWRRVRSQRDDGKELESAGAQIKVMPIAVNLSRNREHAKFRFLCIDLDLYIDNPDTNPFVSIEKVPDAEVETVYHLHTKIREVIIIYFSALTYKEVKTLEKVKKKVDELKVVLNPYFSGTLNEIDVVKVVVTTNTDSVSSFERMYELAAEDGEDGEEG